MAIISRWSKAFRKFARIPITVFLVLAGIGLENGFKDSEHWASDLWAAYFSPAAKTQDSRIAIVYLDEQSLAPLEYTSPIDRKYLAHLIGIIAAQHPRVIGLDLIFDRSTATSKDEELISAIKSAEVPIVIAGLENSQLTAASANFQKNFLLQAGISTGHPYFDRVVNQYSISDEVVREVAAPTTGASIKLSFAEAVARAGNADKHRLNGSSISWLLRPADQSDVFWSAPAEAILADDTIAVSLLSELNGRFVLVGANLPDRDQHLTPLAPSGGLAKTGQRMPGVEIQAQVLAQILDGRSIYKTGYIADCVLILCTLFWGWWRSGKLRKLEEVSTIGLMTLVSLIAFWIFHISFPFIFVLIAWTVGAKIGEAISDKGGAING